MFLRRKARLLLALFAVGLALALAASYGGAQSEKTADPTTHPIVIELFTSEGCSSCPPADALLQHLDESQPIDGAQLIVLSEHVTYWDHEGWKDPNSSEALTYRQNDYEIALGEKDPFTPQFIVDGAHGFQLDHLDKMEELIKKSKNEPRIPVRITDVKLDTANPAILRAHIETDANGLHGADVYVALALSHVESQVLKGENGGRHLVHVAVVQEIDKVGKLPKGKSLARDVELKLKPGTDPKNVRIVAFVQEPAAGKILGATQAKPTI